MTVLAHWTSGESSGPCYKELTKWKDLRPITQWLMLLRKSSNFMALQIRLHLERVLLLCGKINVAQSITLMVIMIEA